MIGTDNVAVFSVIAEPHVSGEAHARVLADLDLSPSPARQHCPEHQQPTEHTRVVSLTLHVRPIP